MFLEIVIDIFVIIIFLEVVFFYDVDFDNNNNFLKFLYLF